MLENKSELERLKEDIKINTSLNYPQGKDELESITYYGEKFIKQKDNCIDKQRVKEAIANIESHGTPYFIDRRDLLKELGLE